jgi:hypothetical protein
LEGSEYGLLEVVLQYFLGRAKENHETFQSGFPVSRPRIEPGTSRNLERYRYVNRLREGRLDKSGGCVIYSSLICAAQDDQIKGDKMGWACTTHRGEMFVLTVP